MKKDEIIKFFGLFSNHNCNGLERFLSNRGNSLVFERLSIIDQEPINYTQLNQLFVISELTGITEAFFNYYWLKAPSQHAYDVKKVDGFDPLFITKNAIISLEHLRYGLYRIYIDTLLYFGNITLGFRRLSNKNEEELINFYKSKRFNTDNCINRGDALALKQIPIQDRYLISEMACKTYEADTDSAEDLKKFLLEQLGEAKKRGVTKISIKNLLAKNFNDEPDPDNKKYATPELFDYAADEIKDEFIETPQDIEDKYNTISQRFKAARESAKVNTHYYLALVHDLDIYVATSMRTRAHFNEMSKNCKDIFEHPEMLKYNLRYFDPTMSAAESHEDKGLIECLMVQSADILIYTSGDRDSYGKDAEATMALSSGKPVIFFCPDEKRYNLSKNVHPLTKLINFRTGVANGAIIVKEIRDVVSVLKRIITNDMQYTLVKKSGRNVKDGYFKLVETLSECDVRVQTNDTLLSECFWNYFEQYLNE